MKIYKRNCNTCGNPYEGYGKSYCSSKCQPRNYSTGVSGEKHGNWKGDKAGYHAIHIWLSKWLGKASRCENKECKYPRRNAARRWILAPKRFEWALKRGRTYSRNKQDYYQLCKSCHGRYDYGLSTGSLA